MPPDALDLNTAVLLSALATMRPSQAGPAGVPRMVWRRELAGGRRVLVTIAARNIVAGDPEHAANTCGVPFCEHGRCAKIRLRRLAQLPVSQEASR